MVAHKHVYAWLRWEIQEVGNEQKMRKIFQNEAPRYTNGVCGDHHIRPLLVSTKFEILPPRLEFP